ncbi:hypothetical protein [Phaffia rhodozyma]|uniref:Uncharacterized protein n=1 Tax=Phaffia rhodozyma TaxID=264483 RepID=A0A0F7SNM2_PHARH|nr:hypothetical protein [Phaffia rhodozyma]
MADDQGCVAVCCGAIGTCFIVSLQNWCNICKTGENTTKKQAGCCPQSFGGANDDDFDDAERKELDLKKANGTAQPGPVAPMSVPLGAPATTNNTTTATP